MNKEINVEVAKLEIMLDVCRRDKDALNFKLAAMQARIDKLEAGIKLAQSKLRSTQINWQEDCLFDCDDILTNTLKGDE